MLFAGVSIGSTGTTEANSTIAFLCLDLTLLEASIDFIPNETERANLKALIFNFRLAIVII